MLFPLPLYADKANPIVDTMMEQELSERLIELSSNNNNNNTVTAPPSLLVVGTPHRQQHEWLSNEQKQQQQQRLQQQRNVGANSSDTNSKDLWTVLTTVTVVDVVRLCWWVTTSSIQWSMQCISYCSVTIRDSLFGHWLGGGRGNHHHHPRSD